MVDFLQQGAVVLAFGQEMPQVEKVQGWDKQEVVMIDTRERGSDLIDSDHSRSEQVHMSWQLQQAQQEQTEERLGHCCRK